MINVTVIMNTADATFADYAAARLDRLDLAPGMLRSYRSSHATLASGPGAHPSPKPAPALPASRGQCPR